MSDHIGEQAIVQALAAAYPGVAPFRFDIGRVGKHRLSGFHALSITEPRPHRLIVSRGFSEVEAPLPSRWRLPWRRTVPRRGLEVSGWGFELTCRVPLTGPDPGAGGGLVDFGWVADWMQAIADQLLSTEASLDPGHHMKMIEPTVEDQVCSLAFVEDPVLVPTSSPFGRVSFLQMVGLCQAEHASLEAWSADRMVELLRARDPLLVCAPRSSHFRDPEFAAAVEAGIARDGSSTGIQFGVPVMWSMTGDRLEVHIAEPAVPIVRRALDGRLRHGRPVVLSGAPRPDGPGAGRTNVVLVPEDGPSSVEDHESTGPTAVVRLTPEAVAALGDALSAQARTGRIGSLDVSIPGLRVVIARTAHFALPSYPW